MFLYLGGLLDTPLYICMPPVCLYAPHMFICPPGSVPTPQGPPMLLCSSWFWHIACCGGVVFLLNVYWGTPPLFGVPPPYLHPPTLHCWFSVHCYSQGYQFLCGGLSPSIEGFGGVPPSLGEVWGGTSALQLFTYSFCYTFL